MVNIRDYYTKRFAWFFALLLLLCASNMVCAETLYGRVVGVTDGDTLTILESGNKQIKVRLAAIDAPEKSQAFGQQSKLALSNICFGKSVAISVIDIDRYSRTVGEVKCSGTNANQAMLKLGMAWVYRKYAKGYGHFFAIEEAAKASKLGLWADANPVPPWEWRHSKKSQQLQSSIQPLNF